MSAAAWRIVGYAGVLAGGLWLAHATAAVAGAQPGDDDPDDRGSSGSAQAVDSRRDTSPVRFGTGRQRAGSADTSDRDTSELRGPGGDRSGAARIGSRVRTGVDIGSDGISVRVGAHQVRISVDTDGGGWSVRRTSAAMARADSRSGAAAPPAFAAAGAGSAAPVTSVPSAAERAATLALPVPQVLPSRGDGAAPLSRRPTVNYVRIDVSTGATVRGTMESAVLPVDPPAPEPEADPEAEMQPGSQGTRISEPPPQPPVRPETPQTPMPGQNDIPPVIEGRPGPGLGAAPPPRLGGAPPPMAPPPMAPPPESPPDLPIGETPPDQPPVIDVGGPVGGGRGADTATAGAAPIQAPVLPAPRMVQPPASVRPLLPVAPPAGSAPPAAAPPLPPLRPGVPGRPVPGAGTPPAGAPAGGPNTVPAPGRGGTPATPAGMAPGGARAEVQRIGYPQYLRSARSAEIAAVALPGAAGLVLLTLGGAVIGYRQANAGRMVRVSSAQRFLP